MLGLNAQALLLCIDAPGILSVFMSIVSVVRLIVAFCKLWSQLLHVREHGNA